MADDDGNAGFAVAGDVEGSAEVEQRQRHAMAYDDRLAGECVHVGVFQRQRLDDTGDGDRVTLLADACEQAPQHAQRDRQGQRERRALARRRTQVDGAAE